MPSFADDIVLAILALLLFGPKKLPVLARELGKWVAEFRRASNEFKYQMEEELRQSEQAERQKQLAAVEAAAPAAPALTSESSTDTQLAAETPRHEPSYLEPGYDTPSDHQSTGDAPQYASAEVGEHSISGGLDSAPAAAEPVSQIAEPLPIATSGSLNMMPPNTGLPVSRGGSSASSPVLQSTSEAKEETAHAD